MNGDLSLFLEVLIGVVTLAASALALVKWILRSIKEHIAKLETERTASEEALRAQATAAESRCEKENADARLRISELEKRSHDEGRQDRNQLLLIVAQNSRAMEKIADHLPDPTPSKGSRTT